MTGATVLVVTLMAMKPKPMPALLVTESITPLTPLLVGVPEMTPVVALRLNPAGKPLASKWVGSFEAVMV